MLKRRWRTVVALLLVGVTELGWSRPLTIGLLSSGQSHLDFERMQQVLQFTRKLTPALTPLGIEESLVLPKNRQQLIEQLQSGEIDLLFGRTFSVLEVKKRAGGQLLAQIHRPKEVNNHVMFVVRQESPIQTLNDLSGQTLAFLQQGSDDGHLLPLSELKRYGLTPLPEQSDELTTTTAPRYRFSGGYKSTVLWILYHKVQVGVIPVAFFNALTPPIQQQLRAIHTTSNFPNRLILASARLNPAIQQILQQQLFQLNTVSLELNQDAHFAPLSEAMQQDLEAVHLE